MPPGSSTRSSPTQLPDFLQRVLTTPTSLFPLSPDCPAHPQPLQLSPTSLPNTAPCHPVPTGPADLTRHLPFLSDLPSPVCPVRFAPTCHAVPRSPVSPRSDWSSHARPVLPGTFPTTQSCTSSPRPLRHADPHLSRTLRRPWTGPPAPSPTCLAPSSPACPTAHPALTRFSPRHFDVPPQILSVPPHLDLPSHCLSRHLIPTTQVSPDPACPTRQPWTSHLAPLRLPRPGQVRPFRQPVPTRAVSLRLSLPSILIPSLSDFPSHRLSSSALPDNPLRVFPARSDNLTRFSPVPTTRTYPFLPIPSDHPVPARTTRLFPAALCSPIPPDSFRQAAPTRFQLKPDNPAPFLPTPTTRPGTPLPNTIRLALPRSALSIPTTHAIASRRTPTTLAMTNLPAPTTQSKPL